MSTGGERGRRRTTEPAAHGRPGGRLLTRPCTADGSDGHHVRVVGSVACRCIAGHHLGKPEHDRIDKPMHLLQLGTQRSGLAAQPVGEPVGLGRPRSGHRRFRSAPRGYRSPCPVGQRKIRACARPSRPPSRRRSRLEQRASWSPHAREATNEIPNRASHEMGDRFRHRGPDRLPRPGRELVQQPDGDLRDLAGFLLCVHTPEPALPRSPHQSVTLASLGRASWAANTQR
ncbi:hypothetical protein SAMN04490239_1420 [Rhodococcus koreensis]|uniref:Uncharacterized protein n=1 Tax=Rhodococcus koreensis TaxID=99653 RepID=A0A1H4LQJ1_9NOCA|nr:hypothetical protein SAMN04490239_1420 [Rhodococcus koreensis]